MARSSRRPPGRPIASPLVRRARVIVSLFAVLAATAGTAVAQQPAPAPVESPVVPVEPPVPPKVGVPRHAAQSTGWARTTEPGVRLSGTPDPAVEPSGEVPSTRVAGEVLAVRTDAGGDAWVRLRYPDRVNGWVPGGSLVPVPAPAVLSPESQAQIADGMRRLGSRGALVVRDPFGRTILSAGTSRALSLASVTKLATVAAALRTGPVGTSTARTILTWSNNASAQRLSTSLGGGSRAAGARHARESVAELGAKVRLVDGSGLSPGNRATAWEITDLLVAMREEPRFPTFLRGLPISARTGTLAGRMRGTSAAGRVKAKTGTLFDHPTSSLCGYIWPAGAGMAIGRALIVCMLENGVSPYRARPAQDTIAQALTAPGALVSDNGPVEPRRNR